MRQRYADKYEINNVTYRTLVKAYGLRFIITVTGKAGKFDVIPLFLTIGAGILRRFGFK
jgi:P2X purinoceptor 4